VKRDKNKRGTNFQKNKNTQIKTNESQVGKKKGMTVVETQKRK
jgi:hypothetical protein